jgi:T4 gene Gp59 loader of gp41 DNA helicase
MQLSEFQAFQIFCAMRLHFKSDKYDYVKYNGATRVTLESYSERKDKYMFQKLAKKYSKENLEHLLVANLYRESDIWVGNLFQDQSMKRYNKRMSFVTSPAYFVANEMDKILNETDFKTLFHQDEPGSSTEFWAALIDEQISPETYIVVNDILQFEKKWNTDNEFIWGTEKKLLTKLKPFTKYDRSLCQKKLLEVLSDKVK